MGCGHEDRNCEMGVRKWAGYVDVKRKGGGDGYVRYEG